MPIKFSFEAYFPGLRYFNEPENLKLKEPQSLKFLPENLC